MPDPIDQRIAAVLAAIDTIDAGDRHLAGASGLMSHHAYGAMDHALQNLSYAATVHAHATTARARETASAAIQFHHRHFADAAEQFNRWLERALAAGSREIPALCDVQALFAACRKLTGAIKVAINRIPTPPAVEGPDGDAARLVLLVVASLGRRARHAVEQAQVLLVVGAKAETGNGRRAALDGAAELLDDLERIVVQLGEWTANGDAIGDASAPAIDVEPLLAVRRALALTLEGERAALEACTVEGPPPEA